MEANAATSAAARLLPGPQRRPTVALLRRHNPRLDLHCLGPQRARLSFAIPQLGNAVSYARHARVHVVRRAQVLEVGGVGLKTCQNALIASVHVVIKTAPVVSTSGEVCPLVHAEGVDHQTLPSS